MLRLLPNIAYVYRCPRNKTRAHASFVREGGREGGREGMKAETETARDGSWRERRERRQE